jgi:serine/threonine protein kinase
MALYYGDILHENILHENDLKIGEFALYKYLGAEILKYRDLLMNIAGKQKLIKLAIECIQRYQSKNIVHRDVCPENMVYDHRTDQVNLIDFDDMLDFSFLKTEDETASCILTESKPNQEYIIHVCMNTGGQENCINIFDLQPRPLTPNIKSIIDNLIKTSGTDPKKYLQSFLTMDYYGLFWIILYILLYPNKIEYIEDKVFLLTITNKYLTDYKSYYRIYNHASKSSFVPKIYEIMSPEYNSNSMIMNFVELVLQLIRDRDADFSLEKLLKCEFLVDPRIQETITRMKEEQDEIDQKDLPLILNEIEKVTKAIQEYIDFCKTAVRVRRKMLKSNEDFKTKIKTMNGIAGELSILETQVGGNKTKYSKHKRTNRYMNKKKIVGRYNTNKKSKPTKSSR